MKILTFIAALAVLLPVPCSAADAVGVRSLDIVAPERPQPLHVTIWYPASGAGTLVSIGTSALFKGAPALRDAEPSPGRHPLILVSHGSGGRIEGLAWIATRLAQAGFIVAGPNHPGTTGGDSTPIATPRVWERTGDMTAVLTALATNPTWRGMVGDDRVGVLGFSLGGTTAMELAGARADRDAYVRYCDTNPGMMDCLWYAGGLGYVGNKAVPSETVDLRQLDKARFERSNRDPRIASAVLIDPGMAQAFKPDSLTSIAIPTHFINLGSAGTVPAGVEAAPLAQAIPKSSYAQVDGAVHFTFLDECQPGGAAVLAAEGETARLCNDAGSRPRAAMHAELADLITAAFTADLKAGDREIPTPGPSIR